MEGLQEDEEPHRAVWDEHAAPSDTATVTTTVAAAPRVVPATPREARRRPLFDELRDLDRRPTTTHHCDYQHHMLCGQLLRTGAVLESDQSVI